eukprot:g38715.t1
MPRQEVTTPTLGGRKVSTPCHAGRLRCQNGRMLYHAGKNKAKLGGQCRRLLRHVGNCHLPEAGNRHQNVGLSLTTGRKSSSGAGDRRSPGVEGERKGEEREKAQ